VGRSGPDTVRANTEHNVLSGSSRLAGLVFSVLVGVLSRKRCVYELFPKPAQDPDLLSVSFLWAN
jgi:hypothetical protein